MIFENSKAHDQLVEELQPVTKAVNDAVMQAISPLMDELLRLRLKQKVFTALRSPSLQISRVVTLNEQYFESHIFPEFGDPNDQTGESRENLLHLMHEAVGEYKDMVRAETKRQYTPYKSILEEEGWQKRPAPTPTEE